ncbi:putative myosin head [Trichinella spiralis]|uniref:putative myosin head n=1 Tax=Trichinella spiralis TaxID=6334 RepID=UPI0001EFEC56|nr:putative myosin head [Trichinella spiralis]
MDVENAKKTNPNYGRPGQFPFQREHIDDEQYMNGSSRFGVHFPTASILSFFCQKASIAPGHRRSPLLDNIVASGKSKKKIYSTTPNDHNKMDKKKSSRFRIEPTNQRWPSVLVPFQSSPARRLLLLCSSLALGGAIVLVVLCVVGGKGEGSLASLVSEWASGIRLYSPLLAAVLHPYCGIFSPFLSNRGQRSRRSPPNLACHSTRRRYELRSTQIGREQSTIAWNQLE